jgi:type IV pilus assembly protein PilE
MKKNKYYFKALSLLEVLITLVIIGVLTLIALPSLMPLVTKAKSIEAQTQLSHVHKLQEMHRALNSRYSDDLKEIGFEHSKLITEGGNANYQITIEKAGISTYVAKATAVVDFDGDGQFNIWIIDQDKKVKEMIED